MMVTHKCPTGITTTWNANPDDVDMSCPGCNTSFIYTTDGWQALGVAEDGDSHG